MARRPNLGIPKYCMFCQVTYRHTVERRSARQAEVMKAKFTRKELGDLVQKRFGSKLRYLNIQHKTCSEQNKHKTVRHELKVAPNNLFTSAPGIPGI